MTDAARERKDGPDDWAGLDRKLRKVERYMNMAGEVFEEIREEVIRKKPRGRIPFKLNRDTRAKEFHTETRKEGIAATIDGRTILLTSSLGALLAELARDGGDADARDDLVGWKDPDKVRQFKGSKGRMLSRRALNERIHRLPQMPARVGILSQSCPD